MCTGPTHRRRIKISQYPAVMAWLETQIQALGLGVEDGEARRLDAP